YGLLPSGVAGTIFVGARSPSSRQRRNSTRKTRSMERRRLSALTPGLFIMALATRRAASSLAQSALGPPPAAAVSPGRPLRRDLLCASLVRVGLPTGPGAAA